MIVLGSKLHQNHELQHRAPRKALNGIACTSLLYQPCTYPISRCAIEVFAWHAEPRVYAVRRSVSYVRLNIALCTLAVKSEAEHIRFCIFSFNTMYRRPRGLFVKHSNSSSQGDACITQSTLIFQHLQQNKIAIEGVIFHFE